jgi:hypothetical protein
MVYTKWLSPGSFLVFVLGLSARETVEYAAADKPEYQWEFKVLQGKEVNAFCLPGGKVAFWAGLETERSRTSRLSSRSPTDQ